MRLVLATVVASCAVVLGANLPVGAQPVWVQQARLRASNGTGLTSLGRGVALSGDTAAVGAACDAMSPGYCGPGAVYLFVRSAGEWTQQAQLAAGDAADDDRFGRAVALDGDTLVAAALPTFINTGPPRADRPVPVRQRQALQEVLSAKVARRGHTSSSGASRREASSR